MSYTIEPHVNGGNAILSTTNGHGSTRIMFNDMLGTTLGMVDNDKLKLNNPTAFGEAVSASPALPVSDSFHTGKPYVPGLGYAFLFRNYRADLGKWQTSDPLGYPDGWNNLAYCYNMALACVDPLGLAFWDAVSSMASSTWSSVFNVAFNPTFQNSFAAASGVLQVATGVALGAAVGWTGVGAVAAGALILNGASTFPKIFKFC